MKKILLFAFVLSFMVPSAQEESKFVDRNNVRSWLNNTGELFGTEEGGFVIKNEDGQDLGMTIFISKLWFATSEDNLSIADYNSTHNGGPIDYDKSLDKVWKIVGGDIKNLIDDYADGKIDDPISSEILAYPARGNSYFGTKLLDKGYAPFKDLNGDGVYNPYDGDYPNLGEDMEDIVPSEMLFTISHDNQNGVGVEFTTLMYTLQCDDVNELENAIFTRHKFRLTKSNYDDFYYTMFIDNDLGCYDDDFIGTDIETQSLYAYNLDDEDGGANVDCASEFEDVPVQGSTFLNQSMYGTMYSMNNAAGSVPPELGDSNLGIEFFNTMKSIWKDGTPMTKGGTGYDKNSTDITKFVFTGNPNNPGEWVQPKVEEYNFYDSRSQANFNVKDVKKDQIITFDAVHHFILNKDQNHIEQINPFLDQAVKFRQMYNDGFKDACFKYTDVKDVDYEESFEVFPNPNNGQFILKGLDQQGDAFILYDVMGKFIEKGTVSGNNVKVVTKTPGVYFFELQRNSKAVGMAKVVMY